MGKFQHPCDSFLPTMKLSTNLRKNQKVHLTSWKSPSDRSIGSFSTGIDPLNIPEGFVWKDGHPYWRTGPWNGQFFIGIPNWNPEYQNGFTVVDDKQGNVYATFAYMDVLRLSKFVLNSQGNLVQTYWNEGEEDWLVVGLAPKDECDAYGTCGVFASCNSLSSPICSCLIRSYMVLVIHTRVAHYSCYVHDVENQEHGNAFVLFTLIWLLLISVYLVFCIQL
jgi:hypothetical protein